MNADLQKDLYTALAKVQAEIPEVKKNRTADVYKKDGTYAYSYSYADLADVSLAILPALGRHDLAFAAFPVHRDDGKFGLSYMLLHSGGGCIEGFWEIDTSGGMQMIGGRVTYARRYALCAVTGVVAEEDMDAREGAPRSRTVQRRQRQPRNDDGQPAEPPQTVQRRPRPAPARTEGPPLPGEDDEAPPPAPQPPPSDAPVTAAQVGRIWTVLGTVFHFGSDERDTAREVCSRIIGRDLPSSKDMTKTEASTVIDTLSRWETEAREHDEDPRGWMLAALDPEDPPEQEQQS